MYRVSLHIEYRYTAARCLQEPGNVDFVDSEALPMTMEIHGSSVTVHLYTGQQTRPFSQSYGHVYGHAVLERLAMVWSVNHPDRARAWIFEYGQLALLHDPTRASNTLHWTV